jgi:2-polyprenyl-6-methoxyphenol hydroxylase-like FAD-dependent oxidoreductase
MRTTRLIDQNRKMEQQNDLNTFIAAGLLPSKAAYNHAVVIGSGIAGLTAAKVLSSHFKRVTVIDRDPSSSPIDFRQGAPQARHAHTLLPQGQRILELLYPGLVNELFEHGAISVNAETEVASFKDGVWLTPKSRAMQSVSSSRPLLENILRERTALSLNVEFKQGYQAVGLQVDEQQQRVTGLRLRDRESANAPEFTLQADLVLDASGRSSRADEWLSQMGFTPPCESRVDALTGYASRIYERPPSFTEKWKMLYVRPSAPGGTRGGIILPMEGNRWHVTLVGMAGDYPPTDEVGFMEFARSLPTPQFYETIQNARPLSKPNGYRRTTNRFRHFEQLPRYLEGFLVFGDAVFTLNPVYALGMTAIAVGSQALERSLQTQLRTHKRGDLSGLAQNFQQQLSQSLTRLWETVTTEDQQWPNTESVEVRLPIKGKTRRRARNENSPVPFDRCRRRQLKPAVAT